LNVISACVFAHAVPTSHPMWEVWKARDPPTITVRTSMRHYAWDIYNAAARARWVGLVIAHNADAAIEAASLELRTFVS
jgi:hypothetical protein